MIRESLRDGWIWWRLANLSWSDPLDPRFAERYGGRWNPAGSFPTLYLNEDIVTARLNLRAFIRGWPYEPEDLNTKTGPALIGARLPRKQTVCDAHTPAGVRALSLPATFPFDADNTLIAHTHCQPIGQKIKDEGLRGVRTRSAQTRDGAGRELAWFPASVRSRATRLERLEFDEWYWS